MSKLTQIEKQEEQFNRFYSQFRLTKEQFNQLLIQFDAFKDSIHIPAQIKKHFLRRDCLIVDIEITIEQFREWLQDNFKFGLMNTRKYWYLFLDWTKEIFEYGYFFKNIDRINNFIKVNNTSSFLRPVDQIISSLPYNICSTAIVANFKIADDKNSFTFSICAEGYDKSETIDKNIKNRQFIFAEDLLQKNDEKKDENEENVDDIKVETKAEEMKRMLEQYANSGIAHAHIAYELIKQQQNSLSNIDLIKQMGLTLKIAKHNFIDDKTIALECVITKRQFIYDFSMFRHENIDQVWNELQADFSQNYQAYNLNRTNISAYLFNLNLSIEEDKNNIYNINVSKPNSIRFWSDIKVC